MSREPFGQRRHDVAARAGVGEHRLAARQLQGGGSVHGPASCTFSGPV